MKRILFAFLLVGLCLPRAGFAAENSWAGEYADKKFLGGQAVFQLTIEQQSGKIQVSFDAVNNDGRGCAPEAQAMASAAGKDKLQFSFRDNQGNAGNGIITRSGNDVVVSLKATRAARPDCTKFYRDGIRAKRMR